MEEQDRTNTGYVNADFNIDSSESLIFDTHSNADITSIDCEDMTS